MRKIYCGLLGKYVTPKYCQRVERLKKASSALKKLTLKKSTYSKNVLSFEDCLEEVNKYMNDLKKYKGQRRNLYDRIYFILYHSNKVTKKEKKFIIIEIANMLSKNKPVDVRYKKIKKLIDEFEGINNAKSSQLKDNIDDIKHQIQNNNLFGTKITKSKSSSKKTKKNISNLSNRISFDSNPISP
jgi:hypothetical protein